MNGRNLLWKASTLSLAAALAAVIASGRVPAAKADAPEPHVAGAIQAFQSAKRHLEALPRSDKRDQAIEYTQDAMKLTEDLGK